MTFTPSPLTTSMSIQEWTAGPYTIAEMLFAYGQHRVQVWHRLDVVSPNW